MVFGWRDVVARGAGAVGASSHVSLAITTRRGGVSHSPYSSLNLGGAVGDDPTRVQDNRRQVAAEFGVDRDRFVYLHQVHGRDVAIVESVPVDGPIVADAAVTRQPGVALAVLAADCVPVLLYDSAAGVVGAAHAGRLGLAAGVVPAVVDAMRGLGASRIQGVVGPSVCGRCYEVPEQMRDDVSRTAPASWSVSWSGTPAVDVSAGVVEQLRRDDVAVTWRPECTREDERYFSHRRDGVTGRFAAVVAITGWLDGPATR